MKAFFEKHDFLYAIVFGILLGIGWTITEFGIKYLFKGEHTHATNIRAHGN